MTIEQILEAIENMKVLELNELVKAAEEKAAANNASNEKTTLGDIDALAELKAKMEGKN